MEAFGLINSLSGGKLMNSIQKKEYFQSNQSSENNGNNSTMYVFNLISLLLMGWAGYLSWSKNSFLHPGNTGMNVFYAICAGLFGGVVYVIFYFISMKELVDLAKECKPVLSASQNFFK